MKLILASKSPRRVEILKSIGAQFEVIPANTDEYVPADMSPEQAVCEISSRKAHYVLKQLSKNNKDKEAFIIAADTVVVSDGKIIGKPRDDAHAYEILSSLSGKSHYVITGFTLCTKDKLYTDYSSTCVEFRELSDDEIRRYIKSGEPSDKAGAYGIQEKGAVFVKSIHGDYFNVVGLPICEVSQVSKKEFNIILENF